MNREYLKPNWPAPKNVSAVCTTRIGGVSEKPFESFNMGQHVGDDPKAVDQNRLLLQQDLSLATPPFWLHQTHSNIVVSAHHKTELCEADAAISDVAGTTCVVMTADCLPILLCDKAGTKVAAIHGGWRGLLSGIIENTIKTMQTEGTELLVWLGPAIGPDAFEIGPEVQQAFVSKNSEYGAAFIASSNNKFMANIYTIAKIQLAKLNVNAIFGGDHCTVNEPDLFYSYRRDNGQTGRMATLIWL